MITFVLIMTFFVGPFGQPKFPVIETAEFNSLEACEEMRSKWQAWVDRASNADGIAICSRKH